MLDLEPPKPTQIEYYAVQLSRSQRRRGRWILIGAHVVGWFLGLAIVAAWNLPGAVVVGMAIFSYFHLRANLSKK